MDMADAGRSVSDVMRTFRRTMRRIIARAERDGRWSTLALRQARSDALAGWAQAAEQTLRGLSRGHCDPMFDRSFRRHKDPTRRTDGFLCALAAAAIERLRADGGAPSCKGEVEFLRMVAL